jgi:hypothetical protein
MDLALDKKCQTPSPVCFTAARVIQTPDAMTTRNQNESGAHYVIIQFSFENFRVTLTGAQIFALWSVLALN